MLGRYRPLRPLGSGGSGSVWLVREESSGREIALKMVRREGPAGPRAEREASAAARLRHEHCLRAYARARDPGHVYIAYEYVPGRTLREALREQDLSDADVVEAGAQILEGLAYAHAHGVVHRDVKPANVLLADAPSVSVKLLDFGLALMREEETLTAVGDIPGTLAYISPERLRGEQAGPEADVWSVGVLLWEALVGHHPLWNGNLLETARSIQAGAPSLRTVRPDLPKPLVALVDRMLSVDPRRRPRAARAAADLRAAGRARPRRRAEYAGRAASISWRAVAARLAPAVSAAVFTAWTASALPFYPTGGWAGLALAAFGLALWSPAAGAAFALAVPVLPLGNHALGLAILYAVLATGWFALFRREARAALFFVLGPLLAPIGALGLLPLAAQVVRAPWRRAVQTAGALLAAGAVAGTSRLGSLGIAEANGPLTAAGALGGALDAHPSYLVQAAALAAAAVALPYARARGLWALGALGAAVTALVVVGGGGTAAWPVVLCVWATAALVIAEPLLRRHLERSAQAARGQSAAVQGRNRVGTVPAEA
jgi:hypothetical protein